MVIIFIGALSVLLFMPVRWINPILKRLPHSVQLIQAKGAIYSAGWKNVTIAGKLYPLTCQYKPQSVNMTNVTYQLDCSAPLKLTATVSMSFSGVLTIKNMHVSGEINDLTPWFPLHSVPVTLNGPIDLSINRLVIENDVLSHLDIRGSLPYICLFSQPRFGGEIGDDCLQQVRINTQQAQLSPAKPMRFAVQSKKDDKRLVSVQIKTIVDGRNYLMQIELSGQPLRDYPPSQWSEMQMTGLNTFMILLKGQML